MTRFSSRLAWQAPINRLATLLAAKRASGETILDLTESNPTQAGLIYPSDAIAALADPAILRYEPQPAGLVTTREAIAAETGVGREQVFVTASTSEAYGYLFKLLADPGDEVLAPRPSYPLFEFLASLEAVRVVQYPLVYDGSWSIDFEALASSVTSRTRAVIVVNPNNPTGSYLKRREAAQLAAWCAERGMAIISDEVFASYGFGTDPERMATLADLEEQALTFCLNGLSKLCGMPQMKLGWITVSGPARERAEAFERLEWIADTYLSVGAPVQHAAPALLRAGKLVQEQIAARTRSNLATLRAAMNDSSCDLFRVEGGWYATLRVPRVRTEEDWGLELLELDNVLVQPGFFYDFESEAFLILSLLTPPDVFAEGARRVAARAARSA